MGKQCDIPSGTYGGAIASIKVTPRRITYMPVDEPSKKLSFDWECKAGKFPAVDGKGIAEIERTKSFSEKHETLVIINVKPGERSKEFPCVFETGFWFLDGTYDGDDNGIDCPDDEHHDDASRIIDRYSKPRLVT